VASEYTYYKWFCDGYLKEKQQDIQNYALKRDRLDHRNNNGMQEKGYVYSIMYSSELKGVSGAPSRILFSLVIPFCI